MFPRENAGSPPIGRPAVRRFGGLFGVLFLVGCTTGPMRINELYYLGASNGKDRVDHRIAITGKTKLGIAEFRQGWFPASSVDALFGDVSKEGAAEALSVQEELRKQIDAALIQARKDYLAVAVNPKTTPEQLKERLEAVRRVRLDARDDANPLAQTTVMEYDPKKSLTVKHSGEKLVLFLASDPDKIINNIAQLSEDTKTEQLFKKFAAVVSERDRKDRARLQSDEDVRLANDAKVAKLIGKAAKVLKGGVKKRDTLLAEIDALISVLQSTGQ